VFAAAWPLAAPPPLGRQTDRDNLNELIQVTEGARGVRPALCLPLPGLVELVVQCLWIPSSSLRP